MTSNQAWKDRSEWAIIGAATFGMGAALLKQFTLSVIPLGLALSLSSLNRIKINSLSQSEVTPALLSSSSDEWRSLQAQVQKLESIVTHPKTDEDLWQQVEQHLTAHSQEINQLLETALPPGELELVYDRRGSRAALLEAIEAAQEHLIFVCPWVSQHALADPVWSALQLALERGVQIEVGWGYLGDLRTCFPTCNNMRIDLKILLKKLLETKGEFFYGGIVRLLELHKEYPNQVGLKLLGTHEKYLICDRRYAIVGSHNFLLSDARSSERESAIKISHPRYVEQLCQQFEHIQERYRNNMLHLEEFQPRQLQPPTRFKEPDLKSKSA